MNFIKLNGVFMQCFNNGASSNVLDGCMLHIGNFTQLFTILMSSLAGKKQEIRQPCLTCHILADLKNQPTGSTCVTHILPFCGYFKGQEQICFNPTSWHLVTYNFI